jgi:hypothetical protein
MYVISNIAKHASKFTADNSPTILTVIGATGVLGTAYLTGKATFRVAEILAFEHEDRKTKHKGYIPPELLADFTFKEKVNFVWKEYIPPATTATVTIAAIIMANRIGSRRVAAMTVAYSLSERAFTEYRDKVVQHMGDKKEQRVRDDIAQDRVDRHPPKPGSILVMAEGKVPCFDAYSARYFASTMEDLKKAQNDLNYKIINNDYASLSEFYDLLDLEHTLQSDNIGWNTEKLLELEFSTCMTPEQKPALSISYRTEPIRGFQRFH